MKVINIQEAKTHLSRLVDSAHEGEEILIGKHGKPLARLISFSPKTQPRPLGGLKIRIADDFDEEDPRISAIFGRPRKTGKPR